MSLQITVPDAAHPSLSVQSEGIEFRHAGPDGLRHFRFGNVECILLAPDHTLSFQVGAEVFSIPTDPNDQQHQVAIASLVQQVQMAGDGWTAAANAM